MWNVLDFLVIFVVFSSARAAEVETMENTFNCYSDYLKRHGVLEQSHESEPFNGESILCETVLSTTVEGIYSALFNEFSKNEELKNAAGCIVGKLRKSKWSDLDLLEQVYDISDMLSDDIKKAKIRELKQFQAKISGDAVVACLADREFGELFDQIFEKEDQEDFVGDYCARKFAVENNLVDTKIYYVNPNPNNIITKEIKCDVLIKEHLKEAEVELRQHLLKDMKENSRKVDCLVKKYHDNHYFNKTLAVGLLGELNITEEQKNLERKKFIASMIKITEILMDCSQ